MKRVIIGLTLAVATSFTAVGCGDSTDDNASDNSATQNSVDEPTTVVSSGTLANVDGTPSAAGSISIREEDGTSYLYLGEDLAVEEGPGDTEVYLAKSDAPIAEQDSGDIVMVGTLANGASGEFLFELSVDASEYTHVIIWCPTAGVNFGVGALGGSSANNTATGGWTGSLMNVDGTPSASGTVTMMEGGSGYEVVFSDDFVVEEGPGDTEVRLAKGMDNVAAQLEADPESVTDPIGTISNGASGAQSFTTLENVGDYTHLIIWCPTAGVNFAVAELTAN